MHLQEMFNNFSYINKSSTFRSQFVNLNFYFNLLVIPSVYNYNSKQISEKKIEVAMVYVFEHKESLQDNSVQF